MNKAYKVRLYPDKEQEVLINKTFGCVRVVWNTLLSKNIEGYKTEGESWKQDYNTTLVKKDFEFMSEVSAASLQQKSRDLKETYTQWFNSVTGKRKGKTLGYPKFKKKGVKIPTGYRIKSLRYFKKIILFSWRGLVRLFVSSLITFQKIVNYLM